MLQLLRVVLRSHADGADAGEETPKQPDRAADNPQF